MTALQDDLLRDILHTDPDRALKEAMASKQATSSVPMDHEPRMNVAPDQTINNDNMSESNFSGQSVPEFQNRPNDHVFKMPQPKPMPQSRQSKKKKELKQEFNNIVEQLEKFPSADYYYELYLTKIKIFHLRVTADVLDQSLNPAPSLNNLMGNTMMDCSSSASQYSSSRGFQGYHNSIMRNSMLNESMRSATTMINYRSQSHTVSSTTHTPPENQSGGAFLPPKPFARNPCNSQPGPSAPNNQDMQETIRSMESAANTTQAGGGSFLGRPAGPAPSRPLNKDVENLRKSKEKNPSPLAKSSPVNQSVVQNSPINMNSTVNNTMNKSSAVNGTFSQRRKSDGPEVTLKNWTLRLDRSSKTKEPGLLLRGTIAKKCEVGNVNEPHESRPVQCRLSEYRIRTVDRKVYNLHGYFQNHSNEVPKLVTSFYMKNRTFPVQWRKMTIAWASASAKPVAEKEVLRSHAEDSPLNSTMTRLKTKERAKVRKTISPPQKPVAKAVCKPVVNPVNKPLAKPFSRPVANPVSKPKPNRDVKHFSRKHATASKNYDTSAMDSSANSLVEVRSKKKPRQQPSAVMDSSANSPVEVKSKKKPRQQPSTTMDSSVNSPVEVRHKKKSRQPSSMVLDSTVNSPIGIRPKKKRQPNPRYWNENDISLSDTDRSQECFADSSNISFKVVSPGRTLQNIKRMKDSNIINSQVTPPTAYFLNVISKSSEKKSEKVERTKKPVKRLVDRVLKKGKSSANVQNIRQSLSTKDPKAIKQFIKESEVRLKKIPSKSQSRMEDEMSDFSDLVSEYSDD